MSDRESFLAVIGERPGDLTRYGVFADWLDENGEPGLAYAYRWAMTRRLWPHRRTVYYRAGTPYRAVPAAYSWGWYLRGQLPESTRTGQRVPDHGFLPRLVFLAGGAGAEHRLHAKHELAMRDLEFCLSQLRKWYGLDPGD